MTSAILHGDLHSGNILVTPDDTVYLLDFEGCDMSAPAWGAGPGTELSCKGR